MSQEKLGCKVSFNASEWGRGCLRGVLQVLLGRFYNDNGFKRGLTDGAIRVV